jgi:exodeoxyribonuclease V alpha subunit
MMTKEIIEGTLTQIRFYKDGFLIGSLNGDRSIKGYVSSPQVGLHYRLEGRWEHSPRWGDTFVVSGYQRSYPKSLPAIRLYLIERAPWIGPETARKVTDAYGEATLEILKQEPERVAKEIKGITLERAIEIATMLRSGEADEALEIALGDVVGTDLSPRLRHKIIELWGPEAPEKIRQNPYSLIDALDGVGFLTADKIAQRVGFEVKGYPRIRAGLLHALGEACWSEGHTYLPRNLLVLSARDILRINPEDIDAVIPKLAAQGDVVLTEDGVYLLDLYADEVFVATKLKELNLPEKEKPR